MLDMMKFLLLITLIGCISACSMPRGWRPTSIAKRARSAEMVVFGKVSSSPEKWQVHETKIPGKMSMYSYKHLKVIDTYSAELEIYCIIKGDDLPRYVNVSGFGWRPGHCVNTPAIEGDKGIFFLTRGEFGELAVHEVNVQLACEAATEKNLLQVLRATHKLFHVPKVPKGAIIRSGKGGCPKLVMNST